MIQSKKRHAYTLLAVAQRKVNYIGSKCLEKGAHLACSSNYEREGKRSGGVTWSESFENVSTNRCFQRFSVSFLDSNVKQYVEELILFF